MLKLTKKNIISILQAFTERGEIGSNFLVEKFSFEKSFIVNFKVEDESLALRITSMIEILKGWEVAIREIVNITGIYSIFCSFSKA